MAIIQAVTLSGVFYGVKHGARHMLDQGGPGVIINISSINAQQPGEGQVAYCAAKAVVDMITRCGALERVIPMNRPVEAREIADAAVYLASGPRAAARCA